jgi:hypothetical protein
MATTFAALRHPERRDRSWFMVSISPKGFSPSKKEVFAEWVKTHLCFLRFLTHELKLVAIILAS